VKGNTDAQAIKGLGTPSPLNHCEKFVGGTVPEYPSPDRPGIAVVVCKTGGRKLDGRDRKDSTERGRRGG